MGGKSGNRWTFEEDQIIINHVYDYPVEVIVNMLERRTFKAVNSRIGTLVKKGLIDRSKVYKPDEVLRIPPKPRVALRVGDRVTFKGKTGIILSVRSDGRFATVQFKNYPGTVHRWD